MRFQPNEVKRVFSTEWAFLIGCEVKLKVFESGKRLWLLRVVVIAFQDIANAIFRQSKSAPSASFKDFHDACK